MVYSTVLFDLDGTLIDPFEGITSCAQYALAHFGINTDKQDLKCFIGPPLRESFPQYYGLDKEQTEIAIEKYRERFQPQGVYENVLYDGVIHMLERLKAQGKTIILATSKPEVYAKKILVHHGIDKYFSFVCGATLDGRIDSKTEVIAHILREMNLDPKACVMVGDREHDVTGALNNGIDAVGVLWGYGSRDELIQSGADEVFETIDDLLI